jgi:alpha-tubulin suppressor-like RCC1 family protein
MSAEGRAYCWGANVLGALGNGIATPVAVNLGAIPPGETLTDPSAGASHACALSAGWAYCWGKNDHGQLGNETPDNRNEPVAITRGQIPEGATLTRVSTGWDHSCALSAAGRAYCWGSNAFGQLGDGKKEDESKTPVAVDGIPAGATLTELSTGAGHTCALSATGQAYCWGENDHGQLGDGTNEPRSTPTGIVAGEIPSGTTLTGLSTGGRHSCALGANSRAYCWGANYHGQLGNERKIDSVTPIEVHRGAIPPGETLSQVSAGAEHTCAQTAEGHAYCWGYNGAGQLGDGDGTSLE